MTVTTAPKLIGSQEPTIKVVPEYLSSAGQEVVDLAAQAGLVLDPWQQMLMQEAMGERADGQWAAFESGVIVGRQNGKSALFEARILAGLFLLEEELIMYSAHEFKTAQEIFRRIETLIDHYPPFKRRVKAISRSKGDEGIELNTRQRVRFLARSTGSGRGFSGDCNIWDECQNLGDAPVDALMPTMSARKNPQLWYGGSAPDKDRAPCEQIARVRHRALSGSAEALAYFEWSATLCTETCPTNCTEHDDPKDPLTWAKTNPGYNIRLAQERIEREADSMSAKGFNRERLSVGNWPSDSPGWEVISETAWRAVEDEQSVVLDPVYIAVDVTPDQAYSSIVVAGARADGLTHGELIDHRSGTDWAVERAIAIRNKLVEASEWDDGRDVPHIALDPGGPAGALVPEFTRRGEELTTPTMREVGNAFGSLYGAIVRPDEAPPGWAPRVQIRPHPQLTAAVQGATTRPLGDAKVWSRRDETPISPLMALTIAVWAYENRPPEELPPVPVAGPSGHIPTNDMFRPSGRLSI